MYLNRRILQLAIDVSVPTDTQRQSVFIKICNKPRMLLLLAFQPLIHMNRILI